MGTRDKHANVYGPDIKVKTPVVDVLGSNEMSLLLKNLEPHVWNLPDDDKFKSYLTAAWTFIINGDVVKAVEIITKIPEDYFREEGRMLRQMKVDKAFDVMVEEIATKISDSGIANSSFTIPHGYMLYKEEVV